MNSNKINQTSSLVITFLAVALTAIGIWFTYSTITSGNLKDDSAKNNVEVNKNVYEKVTSPEKFGTEISPNEEGYGRENPFAPY